MIHRRRNHSKIVREPFGITTNTIEGTWRGLKIIIDERNRSEELIEEYLLEFV